jgi:acyl-coenzyme A thioesterase PaaI-like protein
MWDIIGINSVAMTEPDYLAIIKERGQGALDLKMGIEMLEVSPQRLVARMPVEGNTQPIGLLHGGANVVLAVDINATHHKSATSGYVTAVATPISLGRTLCVYEIVITNEAGQRTCTARITCLILNP